MDSTDRVEFERLLELLATRTGKTYSAQLAEAYWLAFPRMGIVTFRRTVEQLMAREDLEGFPRPNVIWRESHNLRATAPTAASIQAARAFEPHYDQWDIAANEHLMRYIRRRISRHDRARYGGITTSAQAYPQPTPAMCQRVAELVRAKHLWALHMRECPEDRTSEFMERLWTELMQAAEEQIDRLMAGLSPALELAS